MIIILGSGMLGRSLSEVLDKYNMDYILLDRSHVDFLDIETYHDFLRVLAPLADNAVVVNAVAYTSVESAEKDSETAYAVNYKAPMLLSQACKILDFKLIQISTDYVFDGDSSSPYAEYDKTNPINVYGKSKYFGERAVIDSNCDFLILRTGWLYSDTTGIVPSIIRQVYNSYEVWGVSDMFISPTHVNDLSYQILELINTDFSGIAHATAHDYVSFSYLYTYIRNALGYDTKVIEIPAEKFDRSNVKRPRNCVLDNLILKSCGLDRMPTWVGGVQKVLGGLCEE